MVLHSQQQEKSKNEDKSLWGMNIRMVPKIGKQIIQFEEYCIKPEVALEAEKGKTVISSFSQ